MYWVRRVKDYELATLTINSTDKLKQIIDNQETDLLAIELVDIFEIEDLKIDLANK